MVKRLGWLLLLAIGMSGASAQSAYAQCEDACQDLVQCPESLEGVEYYCSDFWACYDWNWGYCVTADQCGSGGCVTACDPYESLECACQVWGGEYCDCYFWPETCGGPPSDDGCENCGGGDDDGGGGGGGDDGGDPNGPADYAFSDCFGQDHDLNGIADCESTAVASTHANGIAHSYCQRFGSECPSVRNGPHKGLDFSADLHNTVNSVTIGYVTAVGYSDANGNYIRIKDPEGRESTYIHLDEPPIRDLGDRVYPGTPIGYAGNTGGAPGMGVHLHLQVKDPQGQVIDPLSLMAEGC